MIYFIYSVGKGWKIEGEIGPWCNCTDCSLPCFTQCWQNNISISGMDFCADDDDEDDDTYKYLRLMCGQFLYLYSLQHGMCL